MGVQTVLRVLVQGASSSISFRGPSGAVMVSVTHRCSIPSFPQERLVYARIGLAYRICPIRARFCSRNPNWFLHCFFSQHFANPCRQQSTVNFHTRRFQSRIRTDIVLLLSDKQSTVSENWDTGARLVWRGKFGETLFILGTAADGAGERLEWCWPCNCKPLGPAAGAPSLPKSSCQLWSPLTELVEFMWGESESWAELGISTGSNPLSSIQGVIRKFLSCQD